MQVMRRRRQTTEQEHHPRRLADIEHQRSPSTRRYQSLADHQHQPSWKLRSLLQACIQACRESGWKVPHFRIRNSPAVTISSLVHDSRVATDGALFFALTGWSVDGHRFVESAIERGAVAVVHSRPLAVYHPQVCYIRTRHPRKLMSLIADVYYGSPSAHLTIVGVTGTDGKSTSCNFVYQLLRVHGISCGLVSTVSRDIGSGLVHNTDHQTTPESIDIHKALAMMVRSQYTHAVLEISSHALSHVTARVLHVRLRCAIITNIAKEHLEFHKTVRRYMRDKLNIISLLSNHSVGTEHEVNHETKNTAKGEAGGMDARAATGANGSIESRTTADMSTEHMAMSGTEAEDGMVAHIEERTTIAASSTNSAHESGAPAQASTAPLVLCGTTVPITKNILAKCRYPVVNYNPDYNPNLSLSCVKHTLTDSSYQYTTENETLGISVGFFGRYNILNAVAAMLCVSHLLSEPPARIAEHCSALSLPTGRFDIITRRHQCAFDVVIDYAHTAQSFTALLSEIREMGYRRIVALFGSAGERDVQKRHDMGAVAARYCDIIIVTSEDPRHEDPQHIADDIVDGVLAQTKPKHHFELGNNMLVIHDRREAIFHAVSLLQPNNILLLLGKGHESSIIGDTTETAWNERQVAQQALATHHGIHL